MPTTVLLLPVTRVELAVGESSTNVSESVHALRRGHLLLAYHSRSELDDVNVRLRQLLTNADTPELRAATFALPRIWQVRMLEYQLVERVLPTLKAEHQLESFGKGGYRFVCTADDLESYEWWRKLKAAFGSYSPKELLLYGFRVINQGLHATTFVKFAGPGWPLPGRQDGQTSEASPTPSYLTLFAMLPGNEGPSPATTSGPGVGADFVDGSGRHLPLNPAGQSQAPAFSDPAPGLARSTGQSCGNCVFFVANPTNATRGYCSKYQFKPGIFAWCASWKGK